jgi:hypothetical protein
MSEFCRNIFFYFSCTYLCGINQTNETMNRKLMTFLLAVSVLFTACSEEKKDDKKESGKEEKSTSDEPKEEEVSETAALTLNATLDLSPLNIPATMSVPEGAEIVAGKYDNTITLGESFNILLTDYGTTVEERKKEVEANDVNKLKQFIVDEENGFVSENEVMGNIEYHFFYVITTTDGQVEFENVKGRGFTRDEALLMYNACKSVSMK